MNSKLTITGLLSVTLTAAALGETSPFTHDYLDDLRMPYTYSNPDLPDFDQRRVYYESGDEGTNYCYPTTGMNLLAYLANNGCPGLVDGAPASWYPGSASLYDKVTAQIEDLGTNYMGTDPTWGTWTSKAATGLDDWMAAHASGCRLWFAVAYSGELTPSRLAEIVQAGGLVNPGVGWYSPTNGVNYIRDGGHICTMAYLSLNPPIVAYPYTGADRIGFHDPARGDGDFTDQSPFNREDYDLGTGETAVFDDGGGSAKATRTLYEVKSYGSSHTAFLDNYVALEQMLLCYVSFDPYLANLKFVARKAWEPLPTEIIVDVPEGILDLALPLGNTRAIYLTKAGTDGLSKLSAASLVDSRRATLATAPNAIALAVSRQQDAYVLYDSGRKLMKTPLRKEPTSQSAMTLSTLNSIACDDVNDRLLGISLSPTARIVEISRDMQSQRQVNLPTRAKVSGPLTISTKTGHLFVAAPRNSCVYEIAFGPTDSQPIFVSQINDTALSKCVALCIDDREHVYASTSTGRGLEFAPTEDGWSRVQDSVLDGLSIGARIATTVTRSNSDSSDVNNPAYRSSAPAAEH
ncbi:MAG: hypothetical protein L0Y58_22535 [Verrucomicrobia subdivision 3 bacterium]|nr:hypothetical protein [Limisphaerales bacterium]